MQTVRKPRRLVPTVVEPGRAIAERKDVVVVSQQKYLAFRPVRTAFPPHPCHPTDPHSTQPVVYAGRLAERIGLAAPVEEPGTHHQ